MSAYTSTQNGVGRKGRRNPAVNLDAILRMQHEASESSLIDDVDIFEISHFEEALEDNLDSGIQFAPSAD